MPKSMTRKRVYIFLVILAVLVAGAYLAAPYWSLWDGEARADSGEQAGAETSEDPSEEAVPVQVAGAEAGKISSFLTATANLRPLREVDVVSQTEGLCVAVAAEEGDRVQEGEVLAQLDDTQLQIRLRSARQRLAQADLQLEKAEIRGEKAATQIANTTEELARYQALYEEELVSEREVAQLRYQLDELQHDRRVSSHETRELAHRVKELTAEIEEVQLQLEQTVIRAPFAGRITRRLVEKGQMVRNLDQLFKLGSFSTLFADVFLSERDASLVRPGQTARLELGSDAATAVEGRVARISPVVDQSTGTVKVTVELTGKAPGFKPGAFVRVGIETDSRSGNVLIPKRAILEEDGRHYVFVAEAGQAQRREVVLGYQTAGRAEVLKGLADGDLVVVAGQGALKPGSRIKIIET